MVREVLNEDLAGHFAPLGLPGFVAVETCLDSVFVKLEITPGAVAQSVECLSKVQLY